LVIPGRFKHSLVAACWSGTLDARRIGPSCFQPSNDDEGMSEDCLSLNIYVPTSVKATSSLLPVMVYFMEVVYFMEEGQTMKGRLLCGLPWSWNA
jgi:carboxylesterase type B